MIYQLRISKSTMVCKSFIVTFLNKYPKMKKSLLILYASEFEFSQRMHVITLKPNFIKVKRKRILLLCLHIFDQLLWFTIK